MNHSSTPHIYEDNTTHKCNPYIWCTEFVSPSESFWNSEVGRIQILAPPWSVWFWFSALGLFFREGAEAASSKQAWASDLN